MTAPALFGNHLPTTSEAPALFDVEHPAGADDVRALIVLYGVALDDARAALDVVTHSISSAQTALNPRALEDVSNTAQALWTYHARALRQLRDRLDTRHVDAWVQRVERAGAQGHAYTARRIVAESLAADAAMIADLSN